MADQWYYKRGDNECGPVSPHDLKRLAGTGELQPTDSVRKEGMAGWVAASQVKGLFPQSGDLVSAVPTSTLATTPPATPGSSGTTPFSERTWVVVVSFLFFPVGLYLLWKHPRWTKRTKWISTGAFFVLLAGGAIGDRAERQAAQQALAEATQLWVNGNKKEAVQHYKRLAEKSWDKLSRKELDVLVSRIIDCDCESGDLESARKWLKKARSGDLALAMESIQAKDLVARVDAEKTAEQARQDESVTADYLPHKPGAQADYDILAYSSPTQGFGARHRYIFSDDGMIGHAITKMWAFKDDEPSGSVWLNKQLSHRRWRVKDGFVELGSEQEGEGFVWEPELKIGARVGDQWEREVTPKSVKTYSVEQFGSYTLPINGKQYPTVTIREESVLSGVPLLACRRVYAKGIGLIHNEVRLKKDNSVQGVWHLDDKGRWENLTTQERRFWE